jgi:hypothetical protein
MSLSMALIQLDSLIAGVESQSEIPIQLSELYLLKTLISSAAKNPGRPAPAVYASLDSQPALRAVKMGLYPTMTSLQSVVDLAKSQLPSIHHNAMTGLMMTYHNTMLDVMERDTNFVPRK